MQGTQKEAGELLKKLNIGVLSLQGSFIEHVHSLKRCGISPIEVKYKEDFNNLDGLIIPGGESTTLTKMLGKNKLYNPIKKALKQGMIAFGTCAGAILLGNTDDEQVKSFNAIDCLFERNAYGRQNESFIADLKIPAVGRNPFEGVFIRAPVMKKLGKAKKLASYNGNTVMAENDKVIISTFHPELTDDLRLHKYFLQKLKSLKH